MVEDLSFKSAVKFCHDLRLSGYSDWRLATLAELEGIYDKNADAPGLARLGGPAKGSDFTWHVKGHLFLTGDEWANNQSGRTSGYQYYFDFNEGKSNNQPSGFPYSSAFMRALCVRGSEKSQKKRVAACRLRAVSNASAPHSGAAALFEWGLDSASPPNLNRKICRSISADLVK